MAKTWLIQRGSIKVTKLILYGSLCVSCVLTSLLIFYDISVLQHLRIRSVVGIVSIVYFLAGLYLIRQSHTRVVNWMLIIAYMLVASSTVLYWGVHATAGIFATSFVIILTGILLGSRAIFPVLIATSLLLITIQTLHSLRIVTPNVAALKVESNYLDTLTYITILGVFALITWISGNQIEQSFKRAKIAEKALLRQKESLASELERESTRLRDAQLSELQQLYRFALLGQSTAATLHELSNHLSILTLDIDDLTEQNQQSKAVANAQESIEQINTMVRQVRRKLNSFDTQTNFRAGASIVRAIKDHKTKNPHTTTSLAYESNNLASTTISGDTLALTQVMTVLISNAHEACAGLPNARITISLSTTGKHLLVSVCDNGIGISQSAAKNLFKPTSSTKPAGLGVGLYLAKQLTETHLGGTITFEQNQSISGACFKVLIPIKALP